MKRFNSSGDTSENGILCYHADAMWEIYRRDNQIERLKARIKELESKASEESWRTNPDRMGT